jgi:hypothetical protein
MTTFQTTALLPPNSCTLSNFQVPEGKPDAHVVLQPLRPMALDALTISFRMKMKETSAFPTVVSYAVGREYAEFALELPGYSSEDAGFWLYVNGQWCGPDQEHDAIPVDEWMTVTATWNGVTGEFAIFVNGEPVVGPTQDDNCKNSIRPGGKLVLGQKQKRRGFTSDGQFIGSVVDLQMWNSVLNAWQLQVLWEGNSSHPDVNVNLILDNPPTYEIELEDGSRCDRECVPGQRHMIWGIYGLPNILLGPTMPYPSSLCRKPPLKQPYGYFSGGRLKDG